MTLKYMQGFESCRDDSDFRGQGWTPSPAGKRVALIPSVSGVAGFSLRQIASFVTGNSPGSGGYNPGSATTPDLGYFNTGITVNQAWTAGGFTFGFGALMNTGNNGAAYGSSTNAGTVGTVCFDGTNYWAIRVVGAAYSVAYSPDLVNWTVPASQPGTLGSGSTISYMGGGVVMVVLNSGTGGTVYYTNNLGLAWTSFSVASLTAGSVTGVGIATGNATYPHVVAIGSNSSPFGGIYVGTLGGTMTQVVTRAATTAFTGHIKVRNGLITVVESNGSAIYTATAANASLNTAGAWSTATASIGAAPVNDIEYHAAGNVWVVTGAGGIYSIPNSGSAGTATALTGAVTATNRYSTVQMNGVFYNGTNTVAHGQQGHIVASVDGITWVEQGAHILPVGTSGTDWRTSLFDGSQYLLFSDPTNGVIAASPNLQTSYQCKYALEGAEVSTALSGSLWGTGLISATAAPSSANGTFSTATGIGQYICIGPASSGTRTVQTRDGAAGAVQNAGGSVTATGYHYFELKCIKVAGTVNSFTTSLYIDGQFISSGTGTSWAPTGDTTSLLVWIFQRNGVFTAVDDLYVTLDDGVANTMQGPLGVVNIVARRPTTNSAVQWVKQGAAASNALSVSQSAISSQSANAVTSANANDKDTYTSTDTLPSGYTAKAVAIEGYFARTTAATPTVNVGILSGSTEVDGAATNIPNATPTYVSAIVERDPNGNAAWTNAAVLAAKLAINHTA